MPANKDAFEDWLDGKAVDKQSEQAWLQDEQLNDDFETSLWLKHQAECFEEQEVPQWDRQTTFERPKKDWFSWLKVSPGLSMAMSVAAILMVLFRVEIHFNDDGMLLTFAGDRSKQMQTLVDEKLRSFGRDQQIIMANYVDDIQARQQEDITQLASYLVTTGRKERQEEITELVTYLKVQRDDDISLQQQQLSNIIYNIQQPQQTQRLQRVSYDPAAARNKLSNKEEK